MDFVRDLRERGFGATVADRLAWGDMRMNPTDLADVTGATYTHLMNGHAPAGNWTGLFQPRERVRLRFINGSAMSYFDSAHPRSDDDGGGRGWPVRAPGDRRRVPHRCG